MNLLLLRSTDVVADHSVTLDDYRAEHIISVLKMGNGDRITLGQINGLMGFGYIHNINKPQVTIARIQLDQIPPPQIDVELILALPRPRMLQRSLQTIATMGVKTLHLIHTERVEKSFWQTPLLKPAAIDEQFFLGLEQARATQMPAINIHAKWRDFAQSVLPGFVQAQKIIAHPGNYPEATKLSPQPAVLAIGPEGGFSPKEVEVFIDANFSPVQLGGRILRVETAVPVLLAKLF
ncbi:MAG: 16S rRNA (uracil(1498)-N(3))-methyltransferase [Marinagarivorans sp.]|nr:16S rRNA (uracil(1498)-N(3))-methyltransferase [Marinagarivorans sp.]